MAVSENMAKPIGIFESVMRLIRKPEGVTSQSEEIAIIEPKIQHEPIKGLAQEWAEQTGNPNPIAWRSRVGTKLPLSDGRILLESGKVIKVDENKKVSLIGENGEKSLGITVYELTPEHLE